MLRLPLEELILRAFLSLDSEKDVRDLLIESLDPPPEKHVDRALTILRQVC